MGSLASVPVATPVRSARTLLINAVRNRARIRALAFHFSTATRAYAPPAGRAESVTLASTIATVIHVRITDSAHR